MKTSIAILLTGTAMVPATAFAQAASDDARQEIIVTAQRYEQRLQDVPLSVSVIGAQELQARASAEISELQYAVPGLSMYQYGVGRQYMQLRGVSNTQGSTTIGIYFDETPVTTDQQGDGISIRMVDMERVEVLRGPQATLYGQGSMGGTIRYIPAAPKLDAFGGAVDGEYSSTRHGASNYKAVGVVNLPLSTDKAALRLVGGYERVGGYVDNVATGENNINRADIYTLRASLLARPTEALTLSLTGLYQNSKQVNQDFGFDYKSTATVATPSNDRYTLIQGKVSYDLDFAELSTTANYIDRHSMTAYDVSPVFVPLLTAVLGLPPGFITQIPLSGVVDYKIWGGEVRLVSQGEGPLGWQVGATYRDLKQSGIVSTSTAPGSLPFAITSADSTSRNKSYAVYGEVNYALTPQLSAIAGLRYFKERKSVDAISSSFGTTVHDNGKASFDSVNPRFNLSYAFTPNSMLFVNVAKGFRSGGFNNTSAGGGVFTVPPSYDPDKVWTYELGTKHQLLDNKLVLDASVYHSQWSKVQSYAFVPGSALSVITNSGHVKGWGVDLSATARPTRELTVTATYGWNNLKFDEATGDKIVGDPVDGAVRTSYSAAIDYRPPLTDSVTGLFRIDYQHAGVGEFNARNFVPPQRTIRPSRDLVNLRVGVTLDTFELALFANNLFDENSPNIVGPYGAINENLEQRPRVIGISASKKF